MKIVNVAGILNKSGKIKIEKCKARNWLRTKQKDVKELTFKTKTSFKTKVEIIQAGEEFEYTLNKVAFQVT